MATTTETMLAEKFLTLRGYEILGTGWTCDAGSIDVVAIAPEGELVFAVAELGNNRSSGFPEERLDKESRTRMELASALWIATHNAPEGRVRFDVLSAIMLDAADRRVYVRHHIDAFGAARA